MFHTQPKLFTDPKIDYPIYDLDFSFADYIKQCKTIIALHRTDLNQYNAQEIVDANAPFEMAPLHQNKKIQYGALLIHGLLDSPLAMHDIGRHLQEKGLLVRAVLLPGHGTVPGALLNVDYHQWLQTVRYGVAGLAKEVEKIFLVGFSTGASLALHQVMEDDANIAGLIFLSPAIKIRSPFAFATHWHRFISQYYKRAAWFNISEEETSDYAKYRSMCFNAVYQLYQLIQSIKKAPQPKCPLFLAISPHDITVCSRASLNYFQKNTHPNSRLILYNNTAQTYPDPRIIIRSSAYPERHIVNFSHIAIPISPTNSHYGEQGDYINASHVAQQNNVVYGDFTPWEIHFNNILIKLKLATAVHRRLTYNPDFAFLTHAIDDFIASV